VYREADAGPLVPCGLLFGIVGRLVGPFKSKVSFAEYSLFYRTLCRRRPRALWLAVWWSCLGCRSLGAPPNRETQISRYLAVQIQLEILV